MRRTRDLIADGLYNDLAVGCHSVPHRQVSLALLANALGATKQTAQSRVRRVTVTAIARTTQTRGSSKTESGDAGKSRLWTDQSEQTLPLHSKPRHTHMRARTQTPNTPCGAPFVRLYPLPAPCAPKHLEHLECSVLGVTPHIQGRLRELSAHVL